jgi:hypothetical protein
MIGVLLVNLGTPEAPDAASVRTYLAEFLSDRRVIEIPPLLWQPILRGIVLRTRPAKSARAYREVWTDEGSPLLAISVRQADKLRERLGDDITVGLAFRYGKRSVAAALWPSRISSFPGPARSGPAGQDRVVHGEQRLGRPRRHAVQPGPHGPLARRRGARTRPRGEERVVGALPPSRDTRGRAAR